MNEPKPCLVIIACCALFTTGLWMFLGVARAAKQRTDAWAELRQSLVELEDAENQYTSEVNDLIKTLRKANEDLRKINESNR